MADRIIYHARERYFWASQGRWYHRCEMCWKSKVEITVDGRIVPPFDNAWVPEDQKYPHANWCPNRQDF